MIITLIYTCASHTRPAKSPNHREGDDLYGVAVGIIGVGEDGLL
jgi:hypothetical protein